jgi:hypothetical protein
MWIKISLVGNCSSVCSGGGETAGRRGVVSSSGQQEQGQGVGGGGGRATVHRERESGAVSNYRKLSVGFYY